MSQHLERDLRALEHALLTMSALVENMIDQGYQALRERKSDLAQLVINADSEVDASEVRIEEDCLKILALHQPVAIDLRRTAAVLKINSDLERIADLAVNIAELAERLTKRPDIGVPDTLERMAVLATQMVRSAIDAFVRSDVQNALQICAKDDEVDSLSSEVINELYRIMRSEPDLVEVALHLFSASRHIERIADHATNIAEDVIYLVRGDIARHRSLSSFEG